MREFLAIVNVGANSFAALARSLGGKNYIDQSGTSGKT